MASGGREGDGRDVVIRVDDVDATSNVLEETEQVEHGVTTSGMGGGRATPRIGVKLKMPSTQLATATKAFKRLVELTKPDSGKVEPQHVVLAAIKETEIALAVVWNELKKVNPVDEVQTLFKEQWIQQHVAGKEWYIRDLKKTMQLEVASKSGSRKSSRSSRALNEARARETVLRLKKKQLEELQEVELQLETARLEREALEQVLGSDEEVSIREVPLVDEDERQHHNEWVCSSPFNVPQEDAPQYDQHREQLETTTQSHLLEHVLLAQAKLPVFKGEELEFIWFIKAFEEQVEAVTADPRRRLYLLLQQLQGEPHTLIKGCQLTTNAAQGYAAARALLEEKYGNPIRLSQAFKEKLLSWPAIRSNSDVSSFCVQLQLCQQVRATQMGLDELDAASTLLRLVSKLPMKLRGTWQNRVADIELNQKRQASFADFVAMVRRFDRARSHPVFGKLEVERKDDYAAKGTAKSLSQVAVSQPKVLAVEQCMQLSETTTAMATQQSRPAEQEKKPSPINAWKPPCIFCQDNHATSKCPKAESWTRKSRLEKLQGLCFSCTKPGHQARGCKARLKCDKCSKMHPTVLHITQENDGGNERSKDECKEQGVKAPESQDETTIKKASLITKCQSDFAVAIAPACVHGANRVVVRAVLDTASTASFITQRLLDKLNVEAVPSSLTITTMAGDETLVVSVVHGLRVTDIDENEDMLIHKAFVVESLPFADEQPLTMDAVGSWPHLASIPFEFVDAPLDMLLGQDVPRAVAPITAVRGGPDEPYAVLTALGWSLQGPLRVLKQRQAKALVNAASVAEVAKNLDRLYYHDFGGAYDFWSKGMSMEDKWWMKQVAAGTSRSAMTGHYTVALPLRPGSSQLHDNREQAHQRLMSLRKQFAQRPQFEADYRAFMDKMLKEQFVEWVDDDVGQEHQVSYVLHHGVYHPRKPGKLRVVFNCAAKFRGVALNDCLVPGPDLTNSIVGVLLRFRQHPVAFMADIDSMFYQVRVPPEQRDLLRLLWWRRDAVAVCRMRVHLFGAASSPGVANFALRRAAEDALAAGTSGVTPEVVQSVHKNFYVDDCLKSVPSEREATALFRGLQAACAYGGFHLGKFLTNRIGVLASIGREEWAKETIAAMGKGTWPDGAASVDVQDKADPLSTLQERALGVAWNVARDEFVFKIGMDLSTVHATKRMVLSSISKLYDPLGVAAPVVITARILFRALVKDEAISSWDEPIPDDHHRRWAQWKEQLSALEGVAVARCYWNAGAPSEESYDLHAFCDASLDAYAAAVYITRGSQVSFVLGKARVSPPKTVTVPRLELVAAKLAAELITIAHNELEVPIKRRILWSDSTTVLKYLQNRSRRFPTFVSNRVESILHLTEPEEWRYVPTGSNPADVGSRGLPAPALGESVWVRGPHFLSQEEAKWPTMPNYSTNELEEGQDNEVTKVATCASKWCESKTAECFVEQLARRYSSMSRFGKALAIWLRFKDYLKAGRKNVTRAMIGPNELKKAEREGIKWLQREAFLRELQDLSDSNDGQMPTVPKGSALYKLSPIWKNSMVHTETRTKEHLPIIPQSNMAQLLVHEAHERQGHLGRNATTAEAMRQHWIIGLNRLVRKVVKGCRHCRFWKAKPLAEKMAPLPDFRCQEGTKAFESTGVDYFGPFLVKQQANETTKVYGVLFTCAATRAVHLELAPDLSSTGFVNALRRFIARRGHVKLMVSDNATNFESASMQLTQELQLELSKQVESPQDILNETRSKGIEWRFNAPLASHHSGFWERLIRTIKRILHVTLGKAYKPWLDEFTTILCECEAILNNRPLTPASDDPKDFEPLTPNHLLLGSKEGAAPPGQYESMAQHLRRRWKVIQTRVQRFWKRWTEEYLVLLRQRSKWHDEAKEELKVGDVVLLIEQLKPRNYWKMGRITKIWYSKKDGCIRVVDVRTTNGEFTRPVTKICLLESE